MHARRTKIDVILSSQKVFLAETTKPGFIPRVRKSSGKKLLQLMNASSEKRRSACKTSLR